MAATVAERASGTGGSRRSPVAGSPAVVARAAQVGDPAESAEGSPESAGAPAGLVARIRWRWAWRWAELPVAIAAESSCCPPTVKGPRRCCPTSVLPHVGVAPSQCCPKSLLAVPTAGDRLVVAATPSLCRRRRRRPSAPVPAVFRAKRRPEQFSRMFLRHRPSLVGQSGLAIALQVEFGGTCPPSPGGTGIADVRHPRTTSGPDH